MRQIVLDTETTGLEVTQGDRVIEIGCVEIMQRQVTGNNLQYYLNPGRDIHAEAIKIHGITKEFLHDKPQFHEIAHNLINYLQGAELIIHNATFDIEFLNNELAMANLPTVTSIASKIIDTLAIAKNLYPGKRNSLNALSARLGVDSSARTLHGALLDAELLAEVYLRMTRSQGNLLSNKFMLAVNFANNNAVISEESNNDCSPINLNGYALTVLKATESELQEHNQSLSNIEKQCNNITLWRTHTVN